LRGRWCVRGALIAQAQVSLRYRAVACGRAGTLTKASSRACRAADREAARRRWFAGQRSCAPRRAAVRGFAGRSLRGRRESARATRVSHRRPPGSRPGWLEKRVRGVPGSITAGEQNDHLPGGLGHVLGDLAYRVPAPLATILSPGAHDIADRRHQRESALPTSRPVRPDVVGTPARADVILCVADSAPNSAGAACVHPRHGTARRTDHLSRHAVRCRILSSVRVSRCLSWHGPWHEPRLGGPRRPLTCGCAWA